MAGFPSAYSIQSRLESCPQGYLEDTEYGHEPGEKTTWRGADIDALSPEEMEGVPSETVLREFEVRLGRIGSDCQSPVAPA